MLGIFVLDNNGLENSDIEFLNEIKKDIKETDKRLNENKYT